jgi:hypothetical protein
MQGVGLVRSAGDALDPIGRPTDDLTWTITPFGDLLLETLRSEGGATTDDLR